MYEYVCLCVYSCAHNCKVFFDFFRVYGSFLVFMREPAFISLSTGNTTRLMKLLKIYSNLKLIFKTS